MKKTAYDIILRPVISEMSMEQATDKKYTFKVERKSNKTEIKKAVEKVFGVKVKGVNTLIVKGKEKRQGRSVGMTSEWKKAIVTLTPDSKEIQFFEGV
jgi:large subunit ribosomal protein L23